MIIEQLLMRLQDRLKDEINRMVLPPPSCPPRHKQGGHRKTMSLSNLSDASSTSGGQTQQFRIDGMAGIDALKQSNE